MRKNWLKGSELSEILQNSAQGRQGVYKALPGAFAEAHVINFLCNKKIPFDEFNNKKLRDFVHSQLMSGEVKSHYLQLIQDRPGGSEETYNTIIQDLKILAQEGKKPARDFLMHLATQQDSDAYNILLQLLQDNKLEVADLNDFACQNFSFVETYLTMLIKSNKYPAVQTQALQRFATVAELVRPDENLKSVLLEWIVSDTFFNSVFDHKQLKIFCEQFKLFNPTLKQEIWHKVLAQQLDLGDRMICHLLNIHRDSICPDGILSYYRENLLRLIDTPIPDLGRYRPLLLEGCITDEKEEIEIIKNDPIAQKLIDQCLDWKICDNTSDFVAASKLICDFIRTDYYQKTIQSKLFATLNEQLQLLKDSPGSQDCSKTGSRISAFVDLKTAMQDIIIDTVIQQVTNNAKLGDLTNRVNQALLLTIKQHEKADANSYTYKRNPVAFYCKWAIGVLACIPTVGLPLLSQTYRNRMFKTCSQAKLDDFKRALEAPTAAPAA